MDKLHWMAISHKVTCFSSTERSIKVEERELALLKRVLTTDVLWPRGWYDEKCKYLPVCMGLWKTDVRILPSEARER